MSKKSNLKKRIVMFMAVVLVLTSVFSDISIVPVKAESTTKYVQATSASGLSGRYVIAINSVTPTTGDGAGSSHRVAVKTSYLSGYDQNLDFAIFNGNDNESSDGMVWDIRSYGSGYSIKVDGGNSYLRIDGAAITLGDEQALSITMNGSSFNISNGSNYIRFTNSFNSKSCFTAGTSAASRDLILYKIQSSDDNGSTDPGDNPGDDPGDDPGNNGSEDDSDPDDEPIYTFAAISDLHTDAGIQEWGDPLRKDVYKTCDAIYDNEDARVLLLGGDLTSAHMGGSWGSSDLEKKANFLKAKAAIAAASESATESHRVLYATGNHEFAVGTKNFNSGDYIDETERYLPELIDAEDIYDVEANAYFQRTFPSGTADNVRHVLAYHYNIDGINFMVLNTPYIGTDNHSNYVYDEDSLRWVENKMWDIGEDKTVFFIAHYPLATDKNVTSSKPVLASTMNVLKKDLLDHYPNAVYLYGHDHGGYKIHFDTYERVTTYDADGNSVDDRYNPPSGFVSSFVGSMSYYGSEVNPSSLGSSDPDVVQGLIIYIYKDRIVFQMKNYGERDLGSYVLKEYVLERDMELDLEGYVDEVSLDQTECELKTGETVLLSAEVLPETAPLRTVTWSSDNEKVAKVDENGLVTAVGGGTAKITATTDDGGYKAKATVTVTWQEWQQPLADLIGQVKQMLSGDMSRYTPESVGALNKALAAAEEAIIGSSDPMAVAGAEEALKAAYSGLVFNSVPTGQLPGVDPGSNPGTPGNGSNGGNTGDSVNVGVLQYKISSGTAAVTALLSNKAKVVIPATINAGGNTVKVTSIRDGAFRNNKKLKSITIGANVKKIGNNAFSGCGKLKTIIFKGNTAPATGKNAFRKIYAKVMIRVPKKMNNKQLKALKKRMKSAGKKAVFKKK